MSEPKPVEVGPLPELEAGVAQVKEDRGSLPHVRYEWIAVPAALRDPANPLTRPLVTEWLNAQAATGLKIASIFPGEKWLFEKL